MHKKIIISFLLILILTENSYAYLGPGVGGGIIAATLGVFIALLAGFFGLIWFPIKNLLKKKKNKDLKHKKID